VLGKWGKIIRIKHSVWKKIWIYILTSAVTRQLSNWLLHQRLAPPEVCRLPERPQSSWSTFAAESSPRERWRGVPDPGPHAVDCRPTMLPKDALHLTGQIICYNTDLRLTAYPPDHLTYMFSRFTRNPGIKRNSNTKRCTYLCCNQTTLKFRVSQLVHRDIISSKLNDT